MKNWRCKSKPKPTSTSHLRSRKSTWTFRWWDLFRSRRRRSHHLKVQVDFLERKWDVLVGFGFDLHLQFFIAQPRWYDDLLGDHRGRGQGQGDVFCARRHSLPAALHGVDHGVEVGNVAIQDGV